jgi:hypothetical protein
MWGGQLKGSMGWTFQEGSGAEHSCVELVLNRLEKGYAVEYAITCKQKVNSRIKNAFMF